MGDVVHNDIISTWSNHKQDGCADHDEPTCDEGSRTHEGRGDRKQDVLANPDQCQQLTYHIAQHSRGKN